MKRICVLAALAALVAMTAGAAGTAAVKITGVSTPVTLKDLVGTDTLVTVVLKESGAKDSNLKVVEALPTSINVQTQKGDIVPYLLDMVDEIQVQGGQVAEKRFKAEDMQMLRPEQQRVVERAVKRAEEIFGAANDDQDLKMQAAVLLALNKNRDATKYLKQLAETNDLTMQLTASKALYLVGEPVSESLLRQGLESGNRKARALAATLAGLNKYTTGIPLLAPLFEDRAVELSAPAARALARLGDRQIIPRLTAMLDESNEKKGQAAVFSLVRLGGDDILQQMKSKLGETEGMIKFRVVSVLYEMKDPCGLDEVRKIFKDYPTLAPEAALILTKNGDWEATQFLRSRLTRREDPTDANLVYRAQTAAALLINGDPSTLAVFQEILRSDSAKAKQKVFELFTDIGNAKLIPILQPSIENVDKRMALDACEAVVSLALSAFRTRILEMRIEE
jgi:HEAT repeat protein